MTTTTKKEAIENRIRSIATRSAWSLGVKTYALEMIESAKDELTAENAQSVLLNGARTWQEYSEGGCALIYDAEIAERLCSPSELKKCKGGERNPNPRETWMDCQARALTQAARMIVRNLKNGKGDA